MKSSSKQMSGDVLDVEVSAKTGTGLDELLEAIALQAEILDLKANPNRAASGAVIEAKLDVGRGPGGHRSGAERYAEKRRYLCCRRTSGARCAR
jgi:hypothetical protein